MFARTPRLTLRPGWPEDAPALATAVAHEAVATHLGRMPWPHLPADAAAFLAIARGPTDASLLIWSHEAPVPQLIGGIGLTREDGEHNLDCWLTPDAWGRGYATEAGRAVVAIARDALGIDRLVARHHPDNPGGGRVLRKLGFVETGNASRYSSARAAAIHAVLYALDLTAGRYTEPLAA